VAGFAKSLLRFSLSKKTTGSAGGSKKVLRENGTISGTKRLGTSE